MKTALVLGGADCLYGDVQWALRLFTPDHIIATNNAGRDHIGELEHWASMHPEKMEGWAKERNRMGRPRAGTMWRPRHKLPPNGMVMREVPSWGGSSGLLAVTVALLPLECTHVVCAGCPLESERAHFDDRRPWGEAARYRGAWQKHFPTMRNRVKSMSGWTRQLLGPPDGEWFADRRKAEAGEVALPSGNPR